LSSHPKTRSGLAQGRTPGGLDASPEPLDGNDIQRARASGCGSDLRCLQDSKNTNTATRPQTLIDTPRAATRRLVSKVLYGARERRHLCRPQMPTHCDDSGNPWSPAGPFTTFAEQTCGTKHRCHKQPFCGGRVRADRCHHSTNYMRELRRAAVSHARPGSLS